MTEQRRWGKAGVRLTVPQIAASNARGRSRAGESAARRAENERVARRKWAAGLVIPHHITLALDLHDLTGPQVDIACHAQEPDVDLWEAGKLYPRWDQLVALAELTQKRPRYFTDAQVSLGFYATSMRFHMPRGDQPPPIPAERYLDHVVARCPGTDAWSDQSRRG